MADKPVPTSPPSHPLPSTTESRPTTGESAALVISHRPMSQRSSDVRDAMAEMAERAQVISQEAGTKIASAMKDVIGTAAGLAGFAVESARDLVQYMVRRGQITQDEADKLIRDAEDAHGRRAARAGKASEPAKGAANVPTKRTAASAIVAIPEKAEKPAKAAKTEKVEKAAKVEKGEKHPKRPAAQKKAATKSATPKKRR